MGEALKVREVVDHGTNDPGVSHSPAFAECLAPPSAHRLGNQHSSALDSAAAAATAVWLLRPKRGGRGGARGETPPPTYDEALLISQVRERQDCFHDFRISTVLIVSGFQLSSAAVHRPA